MTNWNATYPGRLQAYRSQCGLLNEMAGLRFETLNPRADMPEWERCLKACLDMSWGQPAMPWLWLHGKPGVGKSHLAAAIVNYRCEWWACNRYAEACHPVMAMGRFVSVEDLLDELREGFGDDSYQARFESYAKCPLLVLDDMGAHNGTKFAIAKVDQLMDRRYRYRLPTVVTTNPESVLPERTEDRLNDVRVCQRWNLLGKSYRRLKAVPLKEARDDVSA